MRNEIVDALINEIVGPASNPNYVDKDSGEEILLVRVHGAPKSRYGAGMLYPQFSLNNEFDDSQSDSGITENKDLFASEFNKIEGRQNDDSSVKGESNDEEPVGLANQYLPSAMGFTIRVNSDRTSKPVELRIRSAYYEKGSDQMKTKKLDKDGNIIEGEHFFSDYYIRRPIVWNPFRFSIKNDFANGQRHVDYIVKSDSNGKSWLKLRIFDRSTRQDRISGLQTITFVLINDSKSTTNDQASNNKILFQNELKVDVEDLELIAPFPEKFSSIDTEEEKEMNLLYRNKRVYAIGHGAAVEWKSEMKDEVESVLSVSTSVIPTYDLPQIAPTSHVLLSMLELSDIGDWDLAKDSLKSLVKEYEEWISIIERSAINSKSLKNYRGAAQSNVNKCKLALSRIRKGIDYLSDQNSDVVKCFRWMNRAMLWQQQRSKTKIRRWKYVGEGRNRRLNIEGIDGVSDINRFPNLKEFHDAKPENGRWRPFQIAFILMNLESFINPDSKERGIVDLIWFPTGGGKTEAYLGLTAFSIFFRRFKGQKSFKWNDLGGTSVIMRYTLRLLTTQQFERASSLICACDLIRKNNIFILGEEPISIGLWVGGQTPNKNVDAVAKLNNLKRNTNEAYNFVVMKCPCCGSQIGKIENAQYNDSAKTKGITKEDGVNGLMYFSCENNDCEYYGLALPLQVVDEIIYKKPPTLLLGTVDKFAMITWKIDAGSLFGFRKDSKSNVIRIEPPDLIIQDELHLIAGPLGTIVGLYESMIQTMCNNYGLKRPPFISDTQNFVPPKVIASSATISRAYDQVKSLYGIENRDQLNIFPPQGLEFGNTWFSEQKSLDEYDEYGLQRFPGRRYVGILASGYPSAQTSIVRSYSAVLQKIKELESEISIDYYWTLLGYFNSIRELGGASSLVHGDIRERLGQIHSRDIIPFNRRRYVNKVEELTSRISSADIPLTLKKLEESFHSNNNRALDICLATNMVATGVDISRLGLMFIHGQPKTSAEYIQASSRVGRSLPNGPGLIMVLYSPTKPRDKSMYEQFQGFHSRIYSNVEPTSVTPFSVNARERALHAVLIGLIRHFSSGSLREKPILNDSDFDSLFEKVSKILVSRCNIIDPIEIDTTKKMLERIKQFWLKGFQSYGDAGNYQIVNNAGFYPLMYASGSEVRDDVIIDNRSLATLTSMRGVDTESMIKIYTN